MKASDQIAYWAHMLDESVPEQAEEIDERQFGGSSSDYVEPSDGVLRVKDITGMMDAYEGGADFVVNVCMSDGGGVFSDGLSILGRVNGVSSQSGKCELTLAPYMNGRRRKDCSVTPAPAMDAAEIAAALGGVPEDTPVVVKMRDPLKFGPDAMKPVTVPAVAGKVTNGAYGGVFVVVNREQYISERKMVGPAGAAKGQNGGVDEIADFRRKLENGVVEFEFTKADGSRRHAIGTTSEQIVPTDERRRLDPAYDENLESYVRRQAFIIWFWDLEKNAVRCFNTNRFEGIVHYEQTNRRVGLDVERVGNIFIHRDVDPGMEANAPLDDARVENLNQQLQGDLADAGDYGGIAAVITQGLRLTPDDVSSVGIERQPDGQPLLRIVIRKNGANVNNGEYSLNLRRFREYILERYGVDVKKIVVDGEFTF